MDFQKKKIEVDDFVVKSTPSSLDVQLTKHRTAKVRVINILYINIIIN